MRGADNYISDEETSLETGKIVKDSLMAAIINTLLNADSKN